MINTETQDRLDTMNAELAEMQKNILFIKECISQKMLRLAVSAEIKAAKRTERAGK